MNYTVAINYPASQPYSYNASNACLEIEYYLLYTRVPPDITSSAYVKGSIIALYTCIFCFGVFGNVMVLCAIRKFPSLKTARNIYIANLSIGDLVVAMTSLPFSAYVNIYKNWIFTEVLCSVVPLIQGMGIIVSTFTLTAIAIDRYISIVKMKKLHNRAFIAIVASTVIWVSAIIISLPAALTATLVSGGMYPQNFCEDFCEETNFRPTFKKLYGFALLLVMYIVPLSMITFCYYSVFRAVGGRILLQQARETLALGGELNQRAINLIQRSRRTNRMLIGMIVAFGVAQLPSVLLNLIADYIQLPKFIQDQQYLVRTLGHACSMTNTVWNPVFYCFMNETFHDAFRKLLHLPEYKCSALHPGQVKLEPLHKASRSGDRQGLSAIDERANELKWRRLSTRLESEEALVDHLQAYHGSKGDPPMINDLN